MSDFQPTLHFDVNDVLCQILDNVRAILGDQFVGLHLYGSLALGDFDPQGSDIDIVIVTVGELSEENFVSLRDMHDRLATTDSRWSVDVECSYIPLAALRRYDGSRPTDYPRLERGQNKQLEVVKHDTDWILNYYVLREHGVVVAGPDPKTLIDPIRPDQLRQAVRDLLWWWESLLVDTGQIEHSGYQIYAILTMCRILYTHQYGTVASKPVAGRWAQEKLTPRWASLIESALTWQSGQPAGRLSETLDFIRFTLAQFKE
jgi:predicted nucleotidyltransferase